MWCRFVLAGLALLALITLFMFQLRLTTVLGRREDKAANHLDDRRNQ